MPLQAAEVGEAGGTLAALLVGRCEARHVELRHLPPGPYTLVVKTAAGRIFQGDGPGEPVTRVLE